MERKNIKLLVIAVTVGICSVVLAYISPKYIGIYGYKDWYVEKIDVNKSNPEIKERESQQVTWSVIEEKDEKHSFKFIVPSNIILEHTTSTISFYLPPSPGFPNNMLFLAFIKIKPMTVKEMDVKVEQQEKAEARENAECKEGINAEICGYVYEASTTIKNGLALYEEMIGGEGGSFSTFTFPTKGLIIAPQPYFCQDSCENMQKIIDSLEFLK